MVDEHCHGNLMYTAERILTVLSATPTKILIRTRSTTPLGVASTHVRRLLTQLRAVKHGCHSIGGVFRPSFYTLIILIRNLLRYF